MRIGHSISGVMTRKGGWEILPLSCLPDRLRYKYPFVYMYL